MEIILLRGRPAVGKSTLAKALATYAQFPILSKDNLYDPLSVFISSHQKRNRLAHNLLYSVLEQNKDRNVTFILDFPFQNDADFSIISDWCGDKKVEFKSILVTCSDEGLWKLRLEERSENPAPNQLITDFSLLCKHYGDNMQLKPMGGELCIDTIESVDLLLPKICSFLEL